MRRRHESGVPFWIANVPFSSWLPRYSHCPSGPPGSRSGNRAGSQPAARETEVNYDCSVKLTVTVMMTGTGTPFSIVGVYSH